MVAEFGQQQWSCANFRCSDRTLRSRDRIFDFSQEMVKISAGAENWVSAEILTSHAGTTGRYSTGETPPIKAERPEPSDHLGSTCTRINTFYEDLNESSSARLGGSQQLEILPSPNSKRAPNFSAWVLTGGEILKARQFSWRSNFTRRGDFNVRLSSIVYYQADEFYISAAIFRSFPQKFSAEVFRRSFPQQFSAEVFRRSFPQQISAWFFRLNFHETQKFHAFVIF